MEEYGGAVSDACESMDRFEVVITGVDSARGRTRERKKGGWKPWLMILNLKQ